jgi:phage shock protein C
MIGGICGGIGEIMDVDPTIIRLLLVFVTLVTGIFPLTFTYLVAWMIIPLKTA